MERLFEFINGAQAIRCGACRTVELAGRNGGKSGGKLPPDAVARFFSNKGWTVGPTPRKDRCPECIEAARAKRRKTPKGAGDMKPSERLSSVATLPQPGASEQPPREMTRDDRRLVFAKLDEVYIDERTGYGDGWNDHRVAKELGCPRKWVETVREENFGPQKAEQSAEIIEIRGKIESLEKDAKDLSHTAADLGKQAGAALEKATEIFTASAQLAKRAETLRAEVNRIVGKA